MFLLCAVIFQAGCAPLQNAFHELFGVESEVDLNQAELDKQNGVRTKKASATKMTPPKPLLPRLDRVRPKEVLAEYSKILDYGHRGLLKTFERARPDLPPLAKILEDREVSSDLLIVTFVESDFRTEAVGPRGSAGLWQFAKSTGRAYGLTVNLFRDDRKDPIKATKAAALHLGDLYRTFHDWPLALAAYNAGISRVKRACKGREVCDYWALVREKKLPPTTRRYVPRILASLLYLEDKGYWPFTVNNWRKPNIVNGQRKEKR